MIQQILVINALNGTLPLTLRNKYPSATITCAEVFPFYKHHLRNLGFEVADWETIGDMKFDIVVGNPPYNANDTARSDSQHRGQGENLAKKFTQRALELCERHMIFIMPYGHRTYSPAFAEELRQNGLYKITGVQEYFSTIDSNPCAFFFDRTTVVDEVQDLYYNHKHTVPSKNIGGIFFNQPGRLNRQDYEHKLTDTGTHKVVVTTAVVKFTDDLTIIEGMKDPTKDSWRVVFNCTTSKGKFGKIIVVEPGATLSKSVHCLKLPDQASAEHMKQYLESAEVQKILTEVKTVNACNSKKFLQYIPMPTGNKK
jgi:hypothetical protein